MKLGIVVVNNLNERYLDKKFSHVIEIDVVSFTPRFILTCDGRKTVFGWDIQTLTEFIKQYPEKEKILIEQLTQQVIFSMGTNMGIFAP